MSYNEITFNYNAADYSAKISTNDIHYALTIDESTNYTTEAWVSDKIKEQTKDMFVVASKSTDGVHYYQVCYYESSNGEPETNPTYIFAYEIDSNGQSISIANNSAVKICSLFSGITFEDGKSYDFRLENDKFYTMTNPALGEFENEGQLSDIGASGEYAMAANIDELNEFVGEAVTGETASEPETQPEQVEQQVDVTIPTEAEAITTVPTNPDVTDPADEKGSSGMTTAFIITLIVAILAIASSVLLYQKAEKEKEKLKKYKEKQESTDSTKSSEFEESKSKMQDTINELTNQRNTLKEENEKLKNENSSLNRTIKLNASNKDKDKSANDIINAELTKKITLKETEILKRDSQISDLNKEIEANKVEINRLNDRIKDLEATHIVVDSASSGAGNQDASSGFDMEKAAKDISLSISAAEKFAKDYGQTIKYMEANTSVTGEITLSETTLYKQAPILCIGTTLFMNPDFYTNLSSGNEMHDNIMKLSGIFDIKGLSGNIYDVYGLKRIKPATIEYSNSDGKYRLTAVGIIELSAK